jgi:SAM-dependent methyltransferase
MLGPIAGRAFRKVLRVFLQLLFLLREQAKRLTRDSLRYRIPRPGHVHAAHLRRTTPLSTRFGGDRGGAVDRWYIENFLAENAPAIRGRVLESGGNACTLAYGGDRVTGSDVLHVDPAQPAATFSCGLGRADAIPSGIFDCIILTQALHLIYDFQAALDHCHRILKPGGTLLMTVPGISQLDHGEWKDSWYWSFTPAALRKMLAPGFGTGPVIRSHGNVLAATAFLYGMGAGELSEKEKRETDPHYPLVVTAAAIKPLIPCVP